MDRLLSSGAISFGRRRRRVGRGIGSCQGKTCGRGHKGDGSRSGSKSRRGHEGGQKPIFRKVAKRGFNQHGFALESFTLSTDSVMRACNSSDVCDTRKAFARSGAVRIVLGRSQLRNITVHATYFSCGAESAIVGAGGTCVRYENA